MFYNFEEMIVIGQKIRKRTNLSELEFMELNAF